MEEGLFSFPSLLFFFLPSSAVIFELKRIKTFDRNFSPPARGFEWFVLARKVRKKGKWLHNRFSNVFSSQSLYISRLYGFSHNLRRSIDGN